MCAHGLSMRSKYRYVKYILTLEVAGCSACGTVRGGLDGDRTAGLISKSLVLRADQRVDRAEEIVEGALHVGIGRGGWRF